MSNDQPLPIDAERRIAEVVSKPAPKKLNPKTIRRLMANKKRKDRTLQRQIDNHRNAKPRRKLERQNRKRGRR